MSASTIYVTASSSKEARVIAHKVIGERLAACANIIDKVTSVYVWKDVVQQDTEAVLILKTRSDLITPLTNRIKELHSYDCPCITALSISDGNADYIAWITEETSRNKNDLSD